MKLYRYCCGCIGFKHENERVPPYEQGAGTVVGDALLVRTCEDDSYTLGMRTVDVERPYVDENEPDQRVRPLAPEMTEHHLQEIRSLIGGGYQLIQLKHLLGS